VEVKGLGKSSRRTRQLIPV